MKISICLFAFLTGLTALAQELDREAIATAEVSAYVADWSKNLPPRFRKRAASHIGSVVRWSLHYQIDPLLIAVMVSLESSWNAGARGKMGEIGLLQIHGVSAVGDLSDGDQQIEAGVRWLRACIDHCGSVDKGVNRYATGSCGTKWRGLAYRIRLYQKAVKKFRVEK